MPKRTVNLPNASYDVIIEPSLIDELGGRVAAMSDQHNVALILDQHVLDAHGDRIKRSMSAARQPYTVVAIDALESRKTLETIEAIAARLLEAQHDRKSILIAIGGGLTGDVAGFAAAVYLRGVPLIHVPTTLLAMVDAAIGGKTGVNFPLPDGSMGKNLLGAFHQPQAVLIDPAFLSTLDDRELRCGLAESVKHGMIADRGLMTFIESSSEAILDRDEDVLTELIARSAAVKIDIVERDEREAGERALLNLGHTYAHVIEPIEQLGLKHGEAVAIGLCAACHCAIAMEMMNDAEADRIDSLLQMLGLPTEVHREVRIDQLMHRMLYDKKTQAGRIRLILPEGLGSAQIVEDVTTDVVRAGWQAVCHADEDSRAAS